MQMYSGAFTSRNATRPGTDVLGLRPFRKQAHEAQAMPDDSHHIFSNQALSLLQPADRPMAKPPEIFIP